MNDEQLELANAYLDGEATADERALVEADAELLAELPRLRNARAALGDVEPPNPAARESAIAAALAVFDERTSVAAAAGSPATRAAPTNVVPLERRRRLRRLQGLSAAAAAIVIVGGGFAITQRDGGDDSARDTADEQSSVVVLDAPLTTPPDDAGAATDAGAAPDSDAAPGGTDQSMSAIAPSTVAAGTAATANQAAADAADPAATPAAADVDATSAVDAETAEVESESPADAAAPPSAAAPMTTVPARLVVVRDDEDLVAVAESMKSEPLALDDAEAACAAGTLKADAVYEADDGTQRPMVVVTIEDDSSVDLGALSLDDCELVLRSQHDAD